jgi:hypothetical protein
MTNMAFPIKRAIRQPSSHFITQTSMRRREGKTQYVTLPERSIVAIYLAYLT